jgi:hypothetical protein
MEHFTGLSMLDLEEKIIAGFMYVLVIALILLGAYKQATALWNWLVTALQAP